MKETTHAAAYKHITNWLAAPKMDGKRGKKGAVTLLLVPREQWLVEEQDGCWTAIDNHDGYMRIREFPGRKAAESWLKKRLENA